MRNHKHLPWDPNFVNNISNWRFACKVHFSITLLFLTHPLMHCMHIYYANVSSFIHSWVHMYSLSNFSFTSRNVRDLHGLTTGWKLRYLYFANKKSTAKLGEIRLVDNTQSLARGLLDIILFSHDSHFNKSRTKYVIFNCNFTRRSYTGWWNSFSMKSVYYCIFTLN